jgi:hypothetical protein
MRSCRGDFLLLRYDCEGRESADPAVFVTDAGDWHEGDLFLPRGGERFRILAIEPAMDADAEFHAVWTVEPFPGRGALLEA